MKVNKRAKSRVLAGVLAVALAMPFSATAEDLIGAGASFPYPLYSKMFAEYNAKTGSRINYQSVGSGAGINQIVAKTVDFGAMDGTPKDSDFESAAGKIVYLPMAKGDVSVPFNLPGVKEIKLSSELLAEIFLGKVTNWGDKKIADQNPNVKLPKLPITVVHRSDGSGTTDIFTTYLASVSGAWKSTVGAGKAVKWPVGIGAKGNEGVSGQVLQIPGSIGYVEYAYTVQQKMATATLPSANGVYPITGTTWILLYQDQNYGGRTKAKAQELTKLLKWMLNDGQQFSEPLYYKKLSAEEKTAAEETLKGLKFGNENLF
ncbi:phosphate-binding protein [Fibrobacterales bacterium]|nr:phosphate-binding protein [Fibrobacterales bacterium]